MYPTHAVLAVYNVCISSSSSVWMLGFVSNSATSCPLTLSTPARASLSMGLSDKNTEMKWVAVSFLEDLSATQDQPKSAASAMAGGFFYHLNHLEAQYIYYEYTNTHTNWVFSIRDLHFLQLSLRWV